MLTINNSTIVGNTALSGAGGIQFTGTPSSATLQSTIVAENIGPGGPDVRSNSTITVAGDNNLIGEGHTSFNLPATGNQIGPTGSPIDPGVDPLANNGGFTLPDGTTIRTMALDSTSKALDKGNTTGSPGSFDQRGSGYNRVQYGIADVGAFERQAPPTVLSVVFGDGTNQRSMVKQIVVTFSHAVNFSPDVVSAFTLTRNGANSAQPGGTGNVALTANPVNGPTNTVTITFSGGFTQNGSLIDGFYDLVISAGVVSGGWRALDGNNDTIAGGSYSETGTTTGNQLFRLFGDSDGSGQVDFLVDFIAFRNAFANGGPNPIFDFDNSNTVDFLVDFINFRNRFNATP